MRLSLIVLSIIFLLVSCKKEVGNQQTIVNSNVISSYSSEILTVKESFYLRFTEDRISDEEILQEVDSKLFSISPKIDGKALWSDKRTIVFKPTHHWNYKTQYVAELILKNASEEQTKSKISFHTQGVGANLVVRKLLPTVDNNYSIGGYIDCSDYLDKKFIKKMLVVEHEGANLEIDWLESADGQKHSFELKNIIRQFDESELIFKTRSAGPVEHFENEKHIQIPGKNNFSVLELKPLVSGTNYIELVFSDPLDQSQNLDGLIRFKEFNSKNKIDIDGNAIKIYPSPFPTSNIRLIIDKAVKSKAGVSLKSRQEMQILIEPEKPAVRFTSVGNILPHTAASILVFEAKGLEAVDLEIFKIFENNVLQFLQYNRLDNSYPDRAVGKIVHHEKVDLQELGSSEYKDGWARYALNLDQLVNSDPAAIYQIRLGFKQEYANYSCQKDKVIQLSNTGETYKSFMNENWYYNEFEYSHYEDPCFRAYYTSRNFVSKNVMVSNLGLIAKKSTDRVEFFVTNLVTADPIAGANLTLYNFQKQELMKLTTNNKGYASIEGENEIEFILINKEKEYNYLHLQNSYALATSHFDVGGSNNNSGVNGFIYGERGVWRPGDTLHLSFMLEDKSLKFPAEHPIELKLIDSKGTVKEKRISSSHMDGLYVFNIPTSSADPTGNWRAEVSVGNHVFRKKLKVETIKPNRLKIKLGLPADQIFLSEASPVSIQSTWLHGTPASGLKAKIEANYKAIEPRFSGYDEFEFMDPARKMATTNQVVYDKNLSESGEGSFKFSFSKNDLLPGNIKVNLTSRVFEKGGSASQNYSSTTIFPFKSYAGIRVPKSRWGDNYIDQEKKQAIQIANVDKNGGSQASKRMSIGIYESRWSWWYNRSDYNLYKFNSDKHYGAIDTDTIQTNANGLAEYIPKIASGYGNYLVRVCDLESGHCAGTFFYTGSWYSESDDQEKGISKINIKAQKTSYEIGEEVQLNFPSSKDSKILVSIESGNGVIRSEWIDGNGEETSYSFQASKDMLPNVYVNVMMLQSWEHDNDLPMRMYGVAPITVTDQKTILEPQIISTDVFKPNSKVSVKVKEKNGERMAYTIAMVDEGLLDLTNYITPNPHRYFYTKQRHGVRTWDLFDQVMNKMGGDIERIISIGGDGSEEAGANKSNVSRFKPVLYFDGPFSLKKGETNSHEISVPNYMGSVKLMVVAKKSNAYGKAQKVVPVKEELMLLTTLPRVLSPGEEIGIPVNTFWTKDESTSVELSMDANEILTPVKETARAEFTKAGDEVNNLKAKVGNQIGAAKIRVSGSNGKYQAFEETEIEVRNPNPLETRHKDFVLQPKESLQEIINRFGVKGNQSAFVEISNLPSIGLEKRLQYLIRYPYGCLEQTVSSAFPQMYLKDLTNLSKNRAKQVDRNIIAALSKIKNYQRRSGEFSYWRNGSSYHRWSDVYAGHFMTVAKDQGYFVDQKTFSQWIKAHKALANEFESEKKKEYLNDVQAYRLYVLALSKNSNTGAMNRLKNSKNLSSRSKYLLAAAYGVLGQKEVGVQILNRIEKTEEREDDRYYTFGSDLRDESIAAVSLEAIDLSTGASELLFGIAEQLNSSKWFSTQSISFALMAMAKIAGKVGENQLNYTISMDDMEESKVDSKDLINVYDLSLDESAEIKLVNQGDKPLYVTILNNGKELPSILEKRASNLQLTIRYLDENDKEIEIGQLKQGTDFKAVVTVRNPGTAAYHLKDLALAQVFPSGWEIRSGRLKSEAGNKNYTFQDVRDDRVNTFFELRGNKSKTFEVLLNATYAGKFYYPPTECESMYNSKIQAASASKWVEVLTN